MSRRACPIGGAKIEGFVCRNTKGRDLGMGATHGAYSGVRRRFMRSCRPFIVFRRVGGKSVLRVGQSVLRVVGISVALILVIGILCGMTLR
jgi:hypothetical protein